MSGLDGSGCSRGVGLEKSSPSGVILSVRGCLGVVVEGRDRVRVGQAWVRQQQGFSV